HEYGEHGQQVTGAVLVARTILQEAHPAGRPDGLSLFRGKYGGPPPGLVPERGPHASGLSSIPWDRQRSHAGKGNVAGTAAGGIVYPSMNADVEKTCATGRLRPGGGQGNFRGPAKTGIVSKRGQDS